MQQWRSPISRLRGAPRRWQVRLLLGLVVLGLLVPVGLSAATHQEDALGPGSVTQPANGTTVVAIQGFHFQGKGSEKKPARLVAAGSRGGTEWTFDGSERGANWFYDVDPLPNGDLLITSTVPGDTVVHRFDPETKTYVWSEEFDATDTHDVDLINGDELLVANMRNFNETSGKSDDRLFVYNRTRGEITWEWLFRDHGYGPENKGYGDDWSHVNDVDKIAPGEYLVSPRNFDQAIVVNRSRKDIEMRLGEDGNHDVLYEQHNPDFLEGPDGRPTILVADSENDRVLEYARECGSAPERLDANTPPEQCSWERIWTLEGEFKWPRDADRLPNGNTLITDSLHHRVVEVTPEGEIVWEYFATWAPYDSERVVHGGGSNGPTMAEQGVSGTYEVSGGADRGPADRVTFAAWMQSVTAGTPIAESAGWLAQRWSHIAPFVRPVWLSSWGFAAAIGASLVSLLWGLGECWSARRRIATRVRSPLAR